VLQLAINRGGGADRRLEEWRRDEDPGEHHCDLREDDLDSGVERQEAILCQDRLPFTSEDIIDEYACDIGMLSSRQPRDRIGRDGLDGERDIDVVDLNA
jgi:hypothetical protein